MIFKHFVLGSASSLPLYNSLYFLYNLALDVTANCICETHGLALDGLNLNTVIN